MNTFKSVFCVIAFCGRELLWAPVLREITLYRTDINIWWKHIKPNTRSPVTNEALICTWYCYLSKSTMKPEDLEQWSKSHSIYSDHSASQPTSAFITALCASLILAPIYIYVKVWRYIISARDDYLNLQSGFAIIFIIFFQNAPEKTRDSSQAFENAFFIFGGDGWGPPRLCRR